ncbi:MerR family transcriptional regulator [Bacillus sp. B190/17]|uniref:MerR family transcriptional regulator n=1 Tax=Bacillus lumedeiriae TaxID=3058829 RepID=A0ABW8IEP5_9BACI
MMVKYWKISDFAKEVGKHSNTVDGWFKQLEEKRIHMIGRTEHGEKVYDQLDLDIALYIKDKRDQKWALDGIFHELPNHFELRPAMKESEATNVPQVIDLEAMRKEFEKMAREIAEQQTREIKQQYEELLKRLPQPKTIQEERQERITEMITRTRVESNLRDEALNMWSTKPEEERMIRVGFFRKEEDRDKRDQFVRDYINKHFEERIKEEFSLIP